MATLADTINAAGEYQPEPPRPLCRPLAPAEPYPTDALGPTLEAAARAIHDRVQAPATICAQSVLATACLAVQAHADIRLPFGQRRPVSAYLVTVAQSGERKTTADAEALPPVRDYEDDLRASRKADMLVYEAQRGAWEAEHKRILNERKYTQADRERALTLLGTGPTGPLEPLVTCPEPTFEGLTRLFATGRPSLGLFSAEGGLFIGGFGMSEDHRLKTAAGLSLLWDGEPLRRVRAGDGSQVLPGRRLAVHLLVQPNIAAQLLADDVLAGQGLLSRLLVAAPDSNAGTRVWRDPLPTSAEALDRYRTRILEVLGAPLPLRSGTINELEPRVIELTAGARRTWIMFSDHIERQIGPEGALAGLRAFACKAAEHAARLAGVLQLVDDLEASALDNQHLEAGIQLVQFYLSEWERLLDAAATPVALLRAEGLQRWLAAHWTEPAVSLADIYQRGPSALRTAASARSAVETLEAHGWLVCIDGGATVDGAYRREAWRVIDPDGRTRGGG
jgi:hypothetical protein